MIGATCSQHVLDSRLCGDEADVKDFQFGYPFYAGVIKVSLIP